MSVLMEWYDSGSAPHEALGRAARKLSRGGALYLGGGIGVEKRSTPKGDEYNVASAAGSTTETFTGPLSAAMRGYSLAGASTEASTPGGATTIGDPAVAARVAELSERLRSTQQDIERYQRRLARAKAQQASQPYSPVSQPSSIADDDRWEQRQIAELQVEQQQIEAERALLLAGSGLSEVEQARPGTNFTKVPPKNVAKLRPIIDHYKGMAHPFTACVRDQVKHGLSQDHANRRCAVVKDLGAGTTKWRKGAKSGKVAEQVLAEALGRLGAIEETLGVGAAVQLAEQGAPAGATRTVRELVEVVSNDFALLAWAEHPLGLLLFPMSEAGFDEAKHPRGKGGEFISIAGKRVEVGHVLGSGEKVAAIDHEKGKVALAPKAEDAGRVFGNRNRLPAQQWYGADSPKLKRKVEQSPHLPAASSGATRQEAIARRRVRVPGGTATRQEATAASRKTTAQMRTELHTRQAKDASDVAHAAAMRKLDPLKVGDSASHGALSITRKPDAGGKARFDISGPGVPAGGANSVTGSEAVAWMLDHTKDEKPAPKFPAPKSSGPRPQADAAGARERAQIRQTIGMLGKSDKYPIVNGQGKRIGHVEPTDSGYKAVHPQAGSGGTDVVHRFVSPGGAAAHVHKVQQQQRANETARQRGRARRLGHTAEAEAPAGVGMLVEAFASSSGAGGVGTRPDLVAQRQVKRDQASGKLPKPKSSSSKSSSSSSSGGSADSKHPRGHKGTPVGGRFVAKGSSGEDVRAVQRRVGAKPDGKFGTQTRSAVMEFQKAHGLQVDGVIGHQTATALAGHFDAAKTAQVGALKGSDHSKLKAMRRGSSGRSGTVGPRRRGGVVV